MRKISMVLFVWGMILAVLGLAPSASAQPKSILLWPNGAPGSEGKTAPEAVRLSPEGEHIISSVHHPSITPYLPARDKATGAAVLVIPGGGHRELWMDHEGYRIGQWLSDRGIAAFVLKYRLAKDEDSTYTVEGTSLADVQRAIRLLRSRSAEWGIDPERIGVMGFSAGGQLAALAGTRYDRGNPAAADSIDRQSSKPAFQSLIYPGIPQNVKFSNDTPPAFLLCGEDDRPDIAQGLAELYLAMKRAGASAELHVFTKVGHGFGLRDSNHGPVAGWLELFHGWLGMRGLLQRQ